MNYSKTALALASAIGARELINSFERFELDDLLGVVGLERRPSSAARMLPAVALVVFTAAIGAGVALLLAPTSGAKLRARLSDGLGDAKHRLSDAISQFEPTRSGHRAPS